MRVIYVIVEFLIVFTNNSAVLGRQIGFLLEGVFDVLDVVKTAGLVTKVKLRYSAATRQGGGERSGPYRKGLS